MNLDRRHFLYGLGATLGTAAFNALLRAEERPAGPASPPRGGDLARAGDPLAPKPTHVPPRAKACIFLYMEGGPSHIDTFDPKPKLDELHMSEFVRKDRFASAMASGKRYFVRSPFRFRRAGSSGIEMAEGFRHLAEVADDLCIYRGLQAESINHPTANYHMNTGNRFGGDPAVGSWVSYGLGTSNRDLPSFIVLPELHFPQGGAANWSNGFLPAHYQGTTLRSRGSPILDLRPPPGITPENQRRNLDLLGWLNAEHRRRHPLHRGELGARMEAYELAFRMQAEVPGLIDLGRESPRTLSMYGVGEKDTGGFARRCLLARRLVEKGVRFVQVYASGWDSHDYLERSHGARFRATDKPIAALITDLKRRGLLDETLVVWAGEFGRSPDNGLRGGKKAGRDHNAEAMSVWLAGGGVRGGRVVGATDELGGKAVEVVHPIRDLHVTLLRILGLDDSRLIYFHGGRWKQLSQFGGKVIGELVA